MKILITQELLKKILSKNQNSITDILKSLKLIFPEKNKLVITDKILKAFGDNDEIVKKIENDLEEIEYLPDEQREIDEMIDYCIKNNILILSSNSILNLKYHLKKEKSVCLKNEEKISENQFLKLIKIYKEIAQITNKNLYIYLQEIFNYKIINLIDFLNLSSKEKSKIILNYIIEKIENKELAAKIKKNIFLLFPEEIPKHMLYQSLTKLEGYKLGDLDNNDELDFIKYNELIEKFLIEKNIASFEELKRKSPFIKTNKELIKKIVNYYGYKI